MQLDFSEPLNRSHGLNRGLVSRWQVLPGRHGGGGLRFRDLTRRHHGTLTGGPTWVGARGRPNGWGALSFDSSDDFVNCGTIAFTNIFSVALWIRYSSANRSFGYPVENVQDTNNGWAVRVVGNGATANVSLHVEVGGSVTQRVVTGGAALNTWAHWILTSNAGTLAFYKNGVLQTDGADGSGIFTSTARFGIGGGSFSAATLYGGLVDDVRYWTHVLTATEATAVYKSAIAQHDPTLNWLRPVRVFDVGAGGTTVTPTTASLTLTTFAPTVTATDHKTVTPTTAALTLTTFAPTVSTPVVATPQTASLTLTEFAPTVSTPVTATPTTAALTLTTFEPTVTVTADKVVTPTTAALTLTTFAPVIGGDQTVTPQTASLSLTAFAPTVSTPVVATPSTLALTLEGFAPTLIMPVVVTPATLALTLTTFRPALDDGGPTLTGQWSNVITIRSPNQRIRIQSPNKRL